MTSRTSRIEDLGKAVAEYADKEKTRIENEVAALQAILDGRTGGKGVEEASAAKVNKASLYDLKSYLEGG